MWIIYAMKKLESGLKSVIYDQSKRVLQLIMISCVFWTVIITKDLAIDKIINKLLVYITL